MYLPPPCWSVVPGHEAHRMPGLESKMPVRHGGEGGAGSPRPSSRPALPRGLCVRGETPTLSELRSSSVAGRGERRGARTSLSQHSGSRTRVQGPSTCRSTRDRGRPWNKDGGPGYGWRRPLRDLFTDTSATRTVSHGHPVRSLSQ